MFESVPVEELLAAVAAHDFGPSDAEDASSDRIDAVVALDRVIAAAKARQNAHVAALHAERTAIVRLGEGDPSLSVIGELSLARNVSPGAASTQLGYALSLASLPSVSEALGAGTIQEGTARAVARETDALSADDRLVVDAQLAEHLPGLTPGRAGRLARRMVLALDADAARDRAERNRDVQFVSLFPEVDGVALLQVRGPAELLVAAHRGLESWARGLRAEGDARSTGQIMVQTLVERVTGARCAGEVDVEVGIVVDAQTLVGASHEPAELEGYGPIDPGLMDQIIGAAHRAFYRRLITDPVTDVLVGRDPRRRRFDGPLGGFVRARDRWCRQPGCDGRIQALDHVSAWAAGGATRATRADNGQGLCDRSHTFKHLPGWDVRSRGDTVVWRTPTGHTYESPTPAVGLHRRE